MKHSMIVPYFKKEKELGATLIILYSILKMHMPLKFMKNLDLDIYMWRMMFRKEQM
ncbi:MAG: hypothetical protein ABIT58_00415 [Ferruginibacter sp.]